ncbi:MAG: DUF4143 domain-containing protein [Candidatus Microthrix subdominans]
MPGSWLGFPRSRRSDVGERQVRSPKVYVRDSGLLHRLLGLDDRAAVSSHPKLGASWEGFVIEQLLTRAEVRDVWFWGTHAGAEIDLAPRISGGHKR